MSISQPHRHFLGVERSATGRAWRDRLDDRGNARALAIAQRHGLPELLARIVAGRDVETDGVEAFWTPRSNADARPRCLTDMAVAAARFADAAVRVEPVAIFGDYDVDGATSAALLAIFLRRAGIDPMIHIPDRIFEGYGPNIEAIRSLAERGAKLLVTVDCGTTSRNRSRKRPARPRHHRHRPSPSQRGTSRSGGVVNPNRHDDLSGLGHLAAVGLVFMTMVAVKRELQPARILDRRAAAAGPAGHARPRGARHRRRRGGAQGAQSCLRGQGFDRDAAARAGRA